MERAKVGIMLSSTSKSVGMVQMVFPDGIISQELEARLNELFPIGDAEFDQIKQNWMHSDKPGQGKWPRVLIATDGKPWLDDLAKLVRKEISELKCDVDVEMLGTVRMFLASN